MITINAASPVPPYEQIRTQLAEKITDGGLVAGMRLPTVRKLADELGLAVNTVARAYRELELTGMVETRGRGGTVVSAAGDQSRQRLLVSAQEYAELARGLGLGADEALRLVRAALNPSTANRDPDHPDHPSVRMVEVAISPPVITATSGAAASGAGSGAAASGAAASDVGGFRRYPGQDFPECEPRDAEVSVHWDAMDGALTGRVEVLNIGMGACRLSGKPVLSPLGQDHAPLPTDFIVTLEAALPGFVVLQPGMRASARVTWAAWDGAPASSQAIVSWAGGAKEVTVTGPMQPESRGAGGARNLSSSWFELVG